MRASGAQIATPIAPRVAGGRAGKQVGMANLSILLPGQQAPIALASRLRLPDREWGRGITMGNRAGFWLPGKISTDPRPDLGSLPMHKFNVLGL